ncbi:MAG: hypothetical protein COB19_07725 [Porticoccus sp.]|nr:MAG: hypothetical protein COB19_07725 [Porticoccus sp.]
MTDSTIDLPYFGRPICESALEIAEEMEQSAGITYNDKRAEELLKIASSHFNGLSINQEQVENINEASLFNLPTKLDDWPSLLSSLGLTTEANSDFKELVASDDGKGIVELFVHALKHTVKSIAKLEALFLKQPSRKRYRSFSRRANDCLDILVFIRSFALIYEPATDYVAMKVVNNLKIQRANKSRHQASNELKELVLEKADSLYPDLPASASARKLANELDKTLLTSADGKPLLVDNVERFTKWIRDYRKEAKKKAKK